MSEDDEPVSHNGKRRVYRVLAHLAWCDGELHASERALLDAFREVYGIRPDEAAALEAEGRQGGGLSVSKRGAERRLLIDSLIDMATADGVLASAEQERLLRFGRTIGLDEREIAARVVERVGLQGKTLRPESGAGPAASPEP
ncbi:MAG: hypothetical protein D6731_14540 [Planctomycetota bacterium]|nr:MAG: hypothetical protein D6731_14540 [Planctomycetota bacterium]